MPMHQGITQIPKRISIAKKKRGMGGANKMAHVPAPGAAKRLAIAKTRVKKY